MRGYDMTDTSLGILYEVFPHALRLSPETVREIKRCLALAADIPEHSARGFVRSVSVVLGIERMLTERTRNAMPGPLVRDELRQLQRALNCSDTTKLIIRAYSNSASRPRDKTLEAWGVMRDAVAVAVEGFRARRGNPYYHYHVLSVGSMAKAFYEVTGAEPTAFDNGPLAQIVRAVYSECYPERDLGGRKLLTHGLELGRRLRAKEQSSTMQLQKTSRARPARRRSP